MKLMTMLPLAGSLLASTLFVGDASKKAQLRLNLEKGQKVEMVSNMTMNYYTDQKMTEKMMDMNLMLENHYSVSDVSGDVYSIDYMIDRVKLNQSMGGMDINYDSQGDNEGNHMAAQIAAQFEPILQKNISLKVNNMGETVEEATLPEGAANMADMVNMSDNLFISFPEDELEVGDKWNESKTQGAGENEMTMDIVYTVTEISKNDVVIDMKIDPESVEMEGEESPDLKLDQKGSMTFSRDSGVMKMADMSSMVEVESPQMGKIFLVSQIKTEQKSN